MPKEKPDPAPLAGAKPARRALPVLTQNRLFAALVLIVTFFAFAALVLLGVLAIVSKDPPTAMQTRMAEVCDFIIKVSLGALVGLLGGRAAAPDRFEIDGNSSSGPQALNAGGQFSNRKSSHGAQITSPAVSRKLSSS